MTRFRISKGIEELLNNIIKSNSNKTLNPVQGDRNKPSLIFLNPVIREASNFFSKAAILPGKIARSSLTMTQNYVFYYRYQKLRNSKKICYVFW